MALLYQILISSVAPAKSSCGLYKASLKRGVLRDKALWSGEGGGGGGLLAALSLSAQVTHQDLRFMEGFQAQQKIFYFISRRKKKKKLAHMILQKVTVMCVVREWQGGRG